MEQPTQETGSWDVGTTPQQLGRGSREPDFTKGSLKQTTARHQRTYELLRDFTPARSPQNGLDKALAGKSDHRPELKIDLIS